MKKLHPLLLAIVVGCIFLPSGSVPAQEEAPQKLHGKALKEKMSEIQILQGIPEAPYQKLAPLWASKGDMEKTMEDLRKQAAKLGADAIIGIRVRTEKLESTSYDPGWWAGPGWGGGFGPYWGGYWGTMGYWGGYARSHTYTQPVVSGWAIRWEGTPPQNVPEFPLKENLEQAVEDAPQS